MSGAHFISERERERRSEKNLRARSASGGHFFAGERERERRSKIKRALNTLHVTVLME